MQPSPGSLQILGVLGKSNTALWRYAVQGEGSLRVTQVEPIQFFVESICFRQGKCDLVAEGFGIFAFGSINAEQK